MLGQCWIRARSVLDPCLRVAGLTTVRELVRPYLTTVGRHVGWFTAEYELRRDYGLPYSLSPLLLLSKAAKLRRFHQERRTVTYPGTQTTAKKKG
ncbi:hypothetical protein PoB_001957400 [Plakobranchus ocellatus]|uniref:Uncharacterized protein n=1 Tax=Plakobranchus ocellatus TaxID=259542 RepID=A0AAV3ZGP5_9GAST|nr:hypothetical protein PoB_001957400 [Plakobranchus ocellatus]